MNSIILDNQIINALTLLELRVVKSNNFGYYDVNRKIQGYLGKLLDVAHFEAENQTVDLDLLNSNYPAIDIANYRFKIAYQITSETTSSKITETIDKFKDLQDFKNGKLEILRFLFLNGSKLTPTKLQNIKKKYLDSGLLFNDHTILTIPKLEKQLSLISNQKKETLISILDNELNNLPDDLKFVSSKEIEDLKELYGKQRFEGIGRIEDANDENHLRKLSEIWGIDVDEAEILEWDEQTIDNENAGNSVIFKFKIEETTKHIINRIQGINKNDWTVQIFDWEFYEADPNE